MAGNTKWASAGAAALKSTPTRELKSVNGGSMEPITTFYQFNVPQPNKQTGAPPPESAKQLLKDMEVLGIYEGTLITKKYQKTYFKIRTSGGLVAVPSATQLTNLMKKVPQGAEVQIIYRGKNTVEKGQYAGKEAHGFIVNASDLIS